MSSARRPWPRFGFALLSLVGFALLGGACGGESSDSTSSGGSGGSDAGGGSGGGGGQCVADSTAPNACPTTWKLTDACNQLAPTDVLEAAVFDGACPADSVLVSGDTSTAVVRKSFAASGPIPTLAGLSKKTYGFALLARNAGCAVTAYGCTEADLSQIKGIITAICDWSDTSGGAPACACKPLASGACPPSETCSASVCSGI